MNYVVVKTHEELLIALEKCRQEGVFSFDYETAPLDFFRKTMPADIIKSKPTLKMPSLSPHYSDICTLSFCCDTDTVYIVAFKHRVGENIQGDQDKMWQDLKTIFEDDSVVKIAYNLPFEAKFTAKKGILMKNVFDPLHGLIRLYQVIKPNKLNYPLYRGMGLKEQALELFGYKMETFEEAVSGVEHFDETDIEVSKTYAGDDSIFSLMIYNYVKEEMEKIEVAPTVNGTDFGERPYKNYFEVIKNTDCAVMRSIGLMEYFGLSFGHNYKETLAEVEGRIAKGLEKMTRLAKDRGVDINVGQNGKTKSVNEFVFGVLGCPVFEKTEKGKPSLSADALKTTIKTIEANAPNPEVLQDENKVAVCVTQWEERTVVRYPNSKDILEFLRTMETVQKLGTIKSSHLLGRMKYLNIADQKIHSSFNLYTNTGRFASASPNMQNIPRDVGEYSVRDIYQPSKDCVLLCVDYQGQEARIGADLYQDPNMINSILNGIDMHSFVANEVFNLGITEAELLGGVRAEKEFRNPSKVALFGKMFGGSAYSLRHLLRTMGDYKTIAECEKIVKGLSKAFPNMDVFAKNVANFGFDNGYVETALGFRRYLPELRSSDDNEVSSGMRRASNTPVQGTAGDVTKTGMNEVYDKVLMNPKWGLDKVRIVATIHDEVVFEIPKLPIDEMEELVKLICKCMETPLLSGFKLPQIAEPEVADPHDVYGIGKSNGWGSKTCAYKWMEEVRYHEIQKA